MPTPEEIRDLFAMARDPVFAAERARRAAAFDPNRRWVSDDGYRLSDRLWQAKRDTRRQIDALLKQAIATGEDALLTAKKLEQYLDPAYAPIRTRNGRLVRGQNRAIVTTAPGRGGSGSFPARRLARTEITRAHGAGTIAAATATPFATGVRWSLSGRHPKADICDANANHDEGLGRGVWPTGNVPPYPEHPQDLCTLSVALNEDVDAVVDELRREFGLEPAAAPTPPPAAGPAAFPGPFADLAEAEAWASRQYPHITWDFAGAHVDTINPTLAEFHRLAQEWPEVANRLRVVGTYQGKTKGVSSFANQSSAFAHASVDGTRIGLNPAKYNDAAKLRESLRQSERSGWLSDRDEIASNMTHEFGHMVDFWLRDVRQTGSLVPAVRIDGTGIISDLWTSFVQDNFARFRSTDLSQYSVTDADEQFAEGFSYRYHPSSRLPTVGYVRQQAALDWLMARRATWTPYDQLKFVRDLPFDDRPAAHAAAQEAVDDFWAAVKRAERRAKRAQKKASA
jgi:hypothetical protein